MRCIAKILLLSAIFASNFVGAGEKVIDEFLRKNPSYRHVDKQGVQKEIRYLFISPLPNKFYPSPGSHFHMYEINDNKRIVSESMLDADCKDRTFSIANPDEKGVFRYVAWNEKMPEPFFQLLCNTDLSNQRREAIRELKDLINKR